MFASRMYSAASAADGLPLRAATSGSSRAAASPSAPRQHVGVRQQQRGLFVAGTAGQRLVQRHDRERRVLGLDGERARATQLLEALLVVRGAVRLVEEQARQLAELARLLVERGEQVDQLALFGGGGDRGLDGRRGVGRRSVRSASTTSWRAASIFASPSTMAHVLLGRDERALRVTLGLRQLPGQTHGLGVRRAARDQLAEQPARHPEVARAAGELGEAKGRLPEVGRRHSRGGVAAPRFELRLQRRRRPPPATERAPLQHGHRGAVIAARGLQLGAQQLQREALLLGQALVRRARRAPRPTAAPSSPWATSARASCSTIWLSCGRARAGAPQQLEPARSRRPGGPDAATPPRRSRAAASPASSRRSRLGRMKARQRGPVLLAAIEAFQLGEEASSRRAPARSPSPARAARRPRRRARSRPRRARARGAAASGAGLGVEQRLHQLGVLAGGRVGGPQREQSLDQLRAPRRDGQRAFVGRRGALGVLRSRTPPRRRAAATTAFGISAPRSPRRRPAPAGRRDRPPSRCARSTPPAAPAPPRARPPRAARPAGSRRRAPSRSSSPSRKRASAMRSWFRCATSGSSGSVSSTRRLRPSRSRRPM